MIGSVRFERLHFYCMCGRSMYRRSKMFCSSGHHRGFKHRWFHRTLVEDRWSRAAQYAHMETNRSVSWVENYFWGLMTAWARQRRLIGRDPETVSTGMRHATSKLHNDLIFLWQITWCYGDKNLVLWRQIAWCYRDKNLVLWRQELGAMETNCLMLSRQELGAIATRFTPQIIEK